MPLAAETPATASTTPFDPASATIAIVTYNRSGLLSKLLDSLTVMDPKPGHVVVGEYCHDSSSDLAGRGSAGGAHGP